ncbi:beta-ketoacyl reductase, partial [Streptomyces sp. CC208A]|uniref:type I polyketide synthase n=1 Tax=Streptomyces sp. CC208A TaxID=3044573 RepID=UPI0024A94954
EGATTLLELGPDGVLTAMAADQTDIAIPALRKNRDETQSLLTALATLFVHGTPVDWTSTSTTPPAHHVPLPTYAFQHERYWLEALPEAVDTPGDDDSLFHVVWTPSESLETGEPFAWAVLGEERFPEVSSVAEAITSGTTVDAVVLPWARPAVDHPAVAVHTATERMLGLIRQWLDDERLADTPLVVATSGAVATTDDEDVTDLPAAAVWGLVRSAQSEAPDRITLVDTDDTTRLTALLPRLLASGEPQLAVRSGRVLVPRLHRAPTPAHDPAPTPWDPDGTVLITGGTGTLGAEFARHLVAEHRTSRLLLLSRGGENAVGAAELAAELRDLGAQVVFADCDVADRDALAAVLAGVPEEHPVTAVVHTAGVLDNGLLSALTPDRLGAVLRPKADGAWHLHELTRDMGLSAFVLFSSTVGVFGGPGQANYAAANAFLDALAAHRRARGLAATSIAWGVWEAGGINAGLDETDLKRFARDGFLPVGSREGRALFDRAVGADRAALVATPLSLTAVRAQGRVPALLSALAGSPGRRPADSPGTEAAVAADPAAELTARLASLSEPEQERALLTLVRAQVAAVLGRTDPDGLAPERPFQDLGFDSLTAVDLRNRLGTAVGLRLPATLVFDHATPAALTAYLRQRLAPQAPDARQTLLAELDRLDGLLPSLPDDDARTEVSQRLRALLSRLDGSAGRSGGTTDPDAVDALESASVDEIFDFIDNELGQSSI